MKTDLTKQRDSLVRIWYEICSKLTLQEDILARFILETDDPSRRIIR